MAEPAVSPVSQIKPLTMGQIIFEGKIQRVDQPLESEYTYYHLALKAKDEYSMPGVVQVSQNASQRPFGREGDFLRIRCELSGFPRKAGGRTYITNVLTYVETL